MLYRDKSPQLKSTFTLFLKIGALSFGGFMALIASVQKEVVQKKQLITQEDVLDGISLAGLLPGPTAVNVVTYIGYLLKGWRGAIEAFFGVLLPSFLFMVSLSHIYFYNSYSINFKSITAYFMPVVCSIITAAGIEMYQKNSTDKYLIGITIISAFLNVFLGTHTILIGSILGSGIIGYYLYKPQNLDFDTEFLAIKKGLQQLLKNNYAVVVGSLAFFILLGSSLYGLWKWQVFNKSTEAIYYQNLYEIYHIFSTTSLSLFGGGYVFIPFIQKIVVEKMAWIDLKTFTDAIAFGQITPGPIMISSTFIGYKVAGLWGAIVATIAMFAPSAVIMVLFSKILPVLKTSKAIQAAFKGVRAAVVGLVFSASISIFIAFWQNYMYVLIFIVALFVQVYYKINPLYIIPIIGLLSYIMSIM